MKQPEALRLADIIGGDCANELRRLYEVNQELLESLTWCKSQGFVSYTQRTKSNKEFCDSVDRVDAAITKAGEV